MSDLLAVIRDVVLYAWYSALTVFYNTLTWLWLSPLGQVIKRRRKITLDDLTNDLYQMRRSLEEGRKAGVDAAEVAAWENDLVQLEWEHIRRLQRAGRGDDPFVLAKMK